MSSGRRIFQTLSATICCPSAVGWIPSAWFKFSFPPTPSIRNGIRREFEALAISGKSFLKRSVNLGPILSGICIPAMRVFIMGFLVRAFFTIPRRFFLVTSGEIPRSPSLPPRAMIRISAPLLSVQATLRRPPAEVSPLTPAFTTTKGSLACSIFC